MTPAKTSKAAGSEPVVKSSNPWFAVSLCLMGIIVGYAAGSFQSIPLQGMLFPSVAEQPAAPAAPAAPAVPPPTNDTPPTADDDPMLGDEDATVTLIEFTDYQCPYCARHFTQTYNQIKENYVDTGKVKMVVRDFPLSFHPHAQKAAEASECANDQGKFWEMHDLLFTNASTWSPSADAVLTFKQYAADLKLDTKTFNECLDGGNKRQEVLDDMSDGSASGISGTPGFWIIGEDGKGKKISGAYPYDTFKAAFDEML